MLYARDQDHISESSVDGDVSEWLGLRNVRNGLKGNKNCFAVFWLLEKIVENTIQKMEGNMDSRYFAYLMTFDASDIETMYF